MLHNFLWRGPDRITRNTIKGRKEKGGLGMPDINTIYKATSINWIRRYCDKSIDHPWKLFFDKTLKPVGGKELLLKCNFKVNLLNQQITGFLNSMLTVWSELTKEIPPVINNRRYRKPIIWNNKDILISGKSVYFPEFEAVGFVYVEQLFRDGHKMNWNVVHGRGVPQSSTLKWFGLMSAIPKNEMGLEGDAQQTDTLLTFGKEAVRLEECTTRNLTQKIIENQFINPRSEIYHIHQFNIYIDCWEPFYRIPLIATIDTKLREFQYKILHNIITTNVNLFKMKPPRVESAQCTFCESEEETMLHLFYKCQHVEMFWENLFMLWGRKMNLR
ncbi:uncharacterized protein LOC144354150, partial [Saccoglossus kowalevskii]